MSVRHLPESPCEDPHIYPHWTAYAHVHSFLYLLILAWRCVLVFYLKILGSETTPAWTELATDARLDSIAFGCLLAVTHNKWCNDEAGIIGRHPKLFASLGLGMLLLTLAVRDDRFRETFRYSIQGIALYLIFFMCIALPGSAWVKWLSLPPLRWLGWISYTLYLCHYMFIHLVEPYFRSNRPLIMLTAFTMSLLYAVGMRYAIELPLRKIRTNKSKLALKLINT